MEIIKKPINNFEKTRKNKSMVILGNTNSSYDDYVSQIINRMDGGFNRASMYVIKKNGEIIENFNPQSNFSYFYFNRNVSQKLISINLENYGWLKEKDGFFFNWKEDIYMKEPFEYLWRGYRYWDDYTEEQYSSLSELIDFLCNTFNILKTHPNSLNYFDGSDQYNGIMSKSNISKFYFEVTPSFNFDKIIKKEENE